MAKIITGQVLGVHEGFEVMQISAKQELYVRHIVAETAQGLAKMETRDGSYRLVFKQDCFVVVEGLHPNLKTCKHLRFARSVRSGLGAQGLAMGCKDWPKLCKALWQSKLPAINIPGGFGKCLFYADEMAVYRTGSTGWIINRRDIGKYLAILPPEPVIPGDMVIKFCCQICGSVNKIGFAVTRMGPHKKIYSIVPVKGQKCRGCEESFDHECYELVGLNGTQSTGHARETDPWREGKFNLEEWANTPEGKVDPWATQIAAGYPINLFGYGGQIVQVRPSAGISKI